MTLRYPSSAALMPVIVSMALVTPVKPLYAQTPVKAPTVISLKEAVIRAVEVAPGIRGAQADVSAANATVQASRLLPNPTLSAEVENVAGTGSYTRFGQSETTISIAVPFELGGKRAARTRVAQADEAGAQVRTAAARADVTLRTTQAFIALVAAERRVKAATERRDLAVQAERAAQLRVGAGKVSPIDEQRASAQRLRAEVDAQRAQHAAALAQSNLARMMGTTQPLAITAPWFDNTDATDSLAPPTTSLALAVADAQVSAANARVDSARRARIPDLTVTAGARRIKETNDTAAVFALSMPLPLFNRGDADVSRARAELAKAEADRSAVELELAESIAAARTEVDDARASAVSANGPELAAAREAARIARIGYAEGKFAQLDLIEAERSLSQTQEAVIDALAAFHEARARLARLLGSLDPIYKD